MPLNPNTKKIIADLAKQFNQQDSDNQESNVDFSKVQSGFFKTPVATQEQYENYSDYIQGPIDPYYGDIDERRAQAQSNFNKTAKILPRIGTKVIAEIAKMPGEIYGLGEWASTGFDMSKFEESVNNQWMESIDKAYNTTNDELFPVYKRRAVEEGGLLRQIISPEFWATEGADGIGFMLAFMAPGAVSKFLKVGEGAVDIIKGVGLAKSVKAERAAKLAGQIDDVVAGSVNTVLEAGAEGLEAAKATKQALFNKKLTELTNTGLYDPQQASELAAQYLETDEAKRIIGKAGANTTVANLGILIGPNILDQKWLFKGANKTISAAEKLNKTKLTQGLEHIVDPTKSLETVTKATLKDKAKDFGKKGLLGVFKEGFWEEGTQSATSEYYKDRALSKQDSTVMEDVMGIAKEYGKSLSDVDMQKSIFLGSVLGGVGGAVRAVKDLNRENKILFGDPSKNKVGLLKLLENNFVERYKTISDIAETDDNGDIIYNPDGSPKIDITKAQRWGADVVNNLLNKKLGDAYATLNKSSQFEFAKMIHDFNYMLPFFQQEGGKEILLQHINQLAAKDAEYLEKTLGIKPESVEATKQDLLNKVDVFEGIYYDTINAHKTPNIKVSKEQSELFKEFNKTLLDTKISNVLSQDFHRKYAEELTNKISALESKPSLTSVEKAQLKEFKDALDKNIETSKALEEEYNNLNNSSEIRTWWEETVKDTEETKQQIIDEEIEAVPTAPEVKQTKTQAKGTPTEEKVTASTKKTASKQEPPTYSEEGVPVHSETQEGFDDEGSPTSKVYSYLPSYPEGSQHLEIEDIDELSFKLEGLLTPLLGADYTTRGLLDELSASDSVAKFNAKLKQLYDTQYGDTINAIVTEFLITKQNKTKTELIQPAFTTPPQVDTTESEYTDKEDRFKGTYFGSIMEKVILKDGKISTNPPFKIDDPDYSNEYISDPNKAEENKNTTVEFEIYKGDHNSKALSGDPYMVQIMAVMYDKDGVRRPLTMLGAAKQAWMSDQDYKDLLALREEIINGAKEFYKTSKEPIYKSGIKTKAVKGMGKIIQLEEKTTLDKFKGNLLFGIVRWNREQGIYLSVPNSAEVNGGILDIQSKPGNTFVLRKAANGALIPVRVFTPSFAKIKAKNKNVHAKLLSEIQTLISSINKDNYADKLKELQSGYFDSIIRVSKDRKSITFIKKRLNEALSKVKDEKNATARKQLIEDFSTELDLTVGEFEALLKGDKSVMAKNASTKNLAINIQIGVTDKTNPNSVYSEEFERFLNDMQLQVDVNKINRSSIDNNYNKDIAEFLEVNIPQDRLTHSPAYSLDKKVTRSKEVVSGPSNTGVPLFITKDMRQQLSDLGYSKEDIGKMTATQAGDIINKGTTKLIKPSKKLIFGKPAPIPEGEGFSVKGVEERGNSVLEDVDGVDTKGTTGIPDSGNTQQKEENTKQVSKLLKRPKARKAGELTRKVTDSEIKWFAKNLNIGEASDQVKFEIVDTLIKVGDINAWGVFNENLVQVFKNAQEGTVFHEAFHVVFNMALNDDQRIGLLKEAKLKYKLTDEVELEEALSDDFMEYVQSMEYSGKSLPQKILTFFRRIYNFFKHNFLNVSQAEELFYHINNGNFKNVKYTKSDATVRTRYANLNYAEEARRVSAIQTTMSEVVDGLQLRPEFAGVSRLDIIKQYGINNLIKDSFFNIVNKFNDNVDSYSEYNYDQFITMLTGFVDTSEDAEGNTIVPDNPILNELGYKAVNKFAQSEKLVINLDKLNLVNGIDPVTDSEVIEMNEDVDGLEHWMVSATEQSRGDKIKAEIKSLLSRIPIRDAKDEIVKDDLGFNTYLDYKSSFATLLRELSDVTDTEEMVEKLVEVVKYNPEFSDVLSKIQTDEILKTKFWISMQNSHIEYKTIIQEYEEADKDLPIENRRNKFKIQAANRQQITLSIVSDWRDGVLSPVKSNVARKKAALLKPDDKNPMKNPRYKTWADRMLTELEIHLQSPNKKGFERSKDYSNNPEAFYTLISALGFDITLEELNKLKSHTYTIRGYEMNKYSDFVKKMAPVIRGVISGADLVTDINDVSKKAAREIAIIRKDKLESSFRSGDRKNKFSHIMMAFTPKLISQLKRESNFDGTEVASTGLLASMLQTPGYSRLTWLHDLKEINVRENFKFTLLDTINFKGEKEGVPYTKLSPLQLNTVRLNMYYNNGNHTFANYMIPVLSDTPNNAYITAKKLTKTEALEATMNGLLSEWSLIKEAESAKGVKNLEGRIGDFVLFESFNKPEVKDVVVKTLKAWDNAVLTKDKEGKKTAEDKLKKYLTKFLDRVAKETLDEFKAQRLVVEKDGKLVSNFIDHSILSKTEVSEEAETLQKGTYASIESFVSEYAYNNVVSKLNSIMLFTGTPAAYKNTGDLYKRMKEIWAPGTRLDISAKYEITEAQAKAEGLESTTLTVGKEYKNVITKDVELLSNLGDRIYELHKDKGNEGLFIASKFGYSNYTDAKGVKWAIPVDNDGNILVKDGKFDIGFKTEKSSLTDGQSFISPRRRRTIEIGLGTWDNNKQEDFLNLLQGKNSNVAFNPLKPFVFGFRNINGLRIPYQVKNSETLLTPALSFVKMVDGKRKIVLPTKQDRLNKYKDYFVPELAKMLDFMERYSYNDNNYIDEIHFNTAIKVGEKGTVSLETLDETEIQIFNNEDYMIMTEVGDHYTDDASNFGTQIRKLILADISDTAKFSGAFGEFNKSQLIKTYQDVVEASVIDEFNKIDSLFPKSSDSLEEYNEKTLKLSKRLLAEVQERNLGKDAIFGVSTYVDKTGRVRFNIPLFDPIHAKRTQALLGSLYKNNVVKQKINGGNLVMVGSVGYSEHLNINFKEDGSIESFDAYLPWWSEQAVDHLVDPETGIIDIDKIEDKSILNMIGYRIPTEDKYSMIPIKVKGFLPKSSGGIIILPKEITTLSGADFDIDKLYMMFPNIKVIKYEYNQAKKDFDRANKGIAKLFDDLLGSEDNQAISDSEVFNEWWKENKENYLLDTPIIKKVKYDYTKSPLEQSKAARDNALIDMIWSVLTNKDTTEKQTNPGNFEYLTALSKEIKRKTGYSEALELLNPTTETKMFEAAMAANGLIGVFANQNVNHSIFQHGNVTLTEPIRFNNDIFDNLSGIEGKEKIDINSLPKELQKILGNDPKRTSRKLAMMLSAIVDDLKHLNSGPLNINFETADVISVMMRLGINMATSISLINQPAIVELTKAVKSNGGGYKVYKTQIKEIESKYLKLRQSAKKGDATPLSTNNLNLKTLWSNIDVKVLESNNDPEFIEQQLAAIELFDKLNSLALEVGKGVRAFRSDNINRQVTLESNEVFDRNVEEFLKSKAFKGTKALWDSNNMMKAFYEKGVVESSKSMNELYLYNSPLFRSIKDKISANLTGNKKLSEDNIANINYTIMNALISKFEFFNGKKKIQHEGVEISEKEYLLKYFPELFEQTMIAVPKLAVEFPILAKLYKKTKDNYTPIDRIIRKNTNAFTEQDKSDLSDSWLGMMFYKNDKNPELESQIREFGNSLAKYVFHAYGFSYTPQSFGQLLPLTWRASLTDSNGTLLNEYLYDQLDQANIPSNPNIRKDDLISLSLYQQFKQHYAANSFFVERFEPTDDNIKAMRAKGFFNSEDNSVTDVTLNSTFNEDMLVEGDKKGGIFPDMIYIEYKGKPTLLRAIDQNVNDNVVFQSYEPISILGVKNYAQEFEVGVVDKPSMFEFNNPKIKPEVSAISKETIAEYDFDKIHKKVEAGNLISEDDMERYMEDLMERGNEVKNKC